MGVERAEPVRVVTVDDHLPFLDVARDVIAATPGFEPAREVSTGPAAVAAADELEPDLVLVDVHMPAMSGIETTRAIKAAHPSAVVVLISAVAPDEMPAAARGCGAATIVRKQDLGGTLLQEVWARYRGRG
jgi:DNA-binding NarL/FixJ family response regulator